MSAVQQLLTDHIDIWTAADTEKKTGRGRASGNAGSVYGIKKLRELIFELAALGRLVDEDVHQAAKLVRLGEIAEFVMGQAPPGSECNTNGLGTIFVKTGEFGSLYPEVCEWTTKPLKFAKTGDVLICVVGATVGKLNLAIDCAIGRSVAAIRPVAQLDTKYIYFALMPFTLRLRAQSRGSAQGVIGKTELDAVQIRLPSVAEQHRIVVKVDELMALCDQLENQHSNAAEAHEKLVSHLLGTLTQSQSAEDFSANWQRIAAHFDTLFTTDASITTLKQTLLQLAVMGKLVPQDENDEPASELLKRIQAEKARLVAEGKIKKDKSLPPITEAEKPFELPKGWEWVRLGSSLLKITDGTHRSPTNIQKGDFKYISAKNIKSWGLDLSEVTYVTKDVHDEIYGRCDPVCGDILYIKDGATTGIATINTLNEPFSMLSSVALLKPSIGTSNQYLLKSMTSPFFYAEMRSEMTGVAITRVTLAKLNDAIISLPPLPEQHRIVAKVDELMTLCDGLKSRISDAGRLQQKLADVLVEQAVA